MRVMEATTPGVQDGESDGDSDVTAYDSSIQWNVDALFRGIDQINQTNLESGTGYLQIWIQNTAEMHLHIVAKMKIAHQIKRWGNIYSH